VQREFDPGYVRAPYADLVSDYPDESAYPADAFRVEWGPIFHRGRLDGSARLLVIGQDPAAHEAIARRILVGEAGQRIQGFLSRLGIVNSYVFVNTFLYSVFGQGGGEKHVDDDLISRYRHAWIDAIVADQAIEAIVTLGHLADEAYQQWRKTATGAAYAGAYTTVLHPTYPESVSRQGHITKAQAFAKLCESWNGGLQVLSPTLTPDNAVPLKLYGTTLTKDDLTTIPPRDLPAGLPAWMGSLDAWAARTGTTAQLKRATITVTVPTSSRSWPPVAG
jgi:hypothetical protein